MKKNNDFDKISPHLIKQYNINVKTKYKKISIDAKELIVPERIDLIAKIKYINSIVKNYQTKYFYTLYKKTIESFSKGIYKETGNSQKNSFSKYIEDFNKLIIDIKKNKFDSSKSLVPLGSNNAIIDGAHRTSIAHYFNEKIECLKFDSILVNYNYAYFRKNLLEDEFLDYLVLEFCKLKDNVCLMITKFNDQNDILQQIQDKTKIIYEKNIKLNSKAFENLMFQLQEKTKDTFDKNNYNSYKLIIFETENVNKNKDFVIRQSNSTLISMKVQQDEVIKALEILLNKNSMEFLFNTNISINLNLNKTIEKLKNEIKKNNLNSEDFIFTSDIVMELFGLNKCKKIEYLSKNEIQLDNNLTKKIQYNEKKYKQKLDDLLYNPNNYFYYNSLKFLTLKRIKTNNFKMWISLKLTMLKQIKIYNIFNKIKFKLLIKYRNIREKINQIKKLILKNIKVGNKNE